MGLSVPITKLVIKDLIKGDGLEKENVELKSIIDFRDQQIIKYKDFLTTQENVIGNLNSIITKKDEQFSLEHDKSKNLLTELKKQRRKTFFFRVTTLVSVLGVGYLLVK